ncbi:putative transaldolase [Chlamydiales bacterium STE3]|nr:putative transaldolase [Chlamydiales bacterium STE3]
MKWENNRMKIWLDTIHLETLQEAKNLGILSGVTTNPTILSKASSISETLFKLLSIQQGPVAVQLTASTVKEMLEEARMLFRISPRFMIKIPVDKVGLEVMHQLIQEGIPVIGTSVLGLEQAFLAAHLEANMIALYFSHMENPQETCLAILELFKNQKFTTQILGASIKTLEDFLFCARSGIQHATIKEELYHQLTMSSPALKKCLQKFATDWQVAGLPNLTHLHFEK